LNVKITNNATHAKKSAGFCVLQLTAILRYLFEKKKTTEQEERGASFLFLTESMQHTSFPKSASRVVALKEGPQQREELSIPRQTSFALAFGSCLGQKMCKQDLRFQNKYGNHYIASGKVLA
jgi:hypothetical protein